MCDFQFILLSYYLQYTGLLLPMLKLFLGILLYLMQLFDIDIELVFDPVSQLLCSDLRKTYTDTKYLFEKIYAHPCSLQQYL